jgi:hypothetical protein
MLGIGVTPRLLTRRQANVAKTMLLESTGNGTGVSTLRMQVSTTMTVTLEGSARFYTDAAGTLGESTSWTITSGALQTIYLRAPSGSSILKIPTRYYLTRFGSSTTDGWTSAANAARLTFTPSHYTNLLQLRMTGTSTIVGALPTGLTYFNLEGNLINWTYTGALPTGLTYLWLEGNLINWTYTGALPTGLTVLRLLGPNINWTWGVALPTGLTFLRLEGPNINWTGLDASGSGNITTFNISNHRISKMTDAELVTLLTSMANRTGALPAAATVGDIANPTSTDQGVLDALALVLANKGCTVTRVA